MLACTILGVTQEMNLATNSSASFLTLQLPNGEVLRTVVDDATVQKVVELHVQMAGIPENRSDALPAPSFHVGEPVSVASPPEYSASEAANELDAHVIATGGDELHIFGGQDLPDKTSPPLPPEPPPAPAPVVSNIQRLANGKVIVPSRQGDRNEFGYPRNAGVDPADVTGTFNTDEDGTSSV